MWIRKGNQIINLGNVFDFIKVSDEIRFFYGRAETPDAIFKFSSEKEAEDSFDDIIQFGVRDVIDLTELG